MITALFNNLQTAGSGFVDLLKNLITSVFSIIYTPGTESAAGSFTDIGVLVLVAMGVGIVYGIIRWIMSLVRKTA